MLEHQLMDRLVQALGERRRLWPPDQGSSIACIGLLGWMQLMYLRPDRMERETKGWMWLGGLLESGSKAHGLYRGSKAFDGGDQRAIDVYASAVAGGVFQVTGRPRTEGSEASGVAEWQPEDIEMLKTLGTKHGDVVREMLVGTLANPEEWRDHDMPMRDERNASQLDDALIDDDEAHVPGLDALPKKYEVRNAVHPRDIQKDPPRRSS